MKKKAPTLQQLKDAQKSAQIVVRGDDREKLTWDGRLNTGLWMPPKQGFSRPLPVELESKVVGGVRPQDFELVGEYKPRFYVVASMGLHWPHGVGHGEQKPLLLRVGEHDTLTMAEMLKRLHWIRKEKRDWPADEPKQSEPKEPEPFVLDEHRVADPMKSALAFAALLGHESRLVKRGTGVDVVIVHNQQAMRFTKAPDTKAREQGTGLFMHDGKWERLCKCGHTLGEHAAEKVKGQRPCFHGDSAGEEPCDCTLYKATGKAR